MMNKELQKGDIYLPGDLGEIVIGSTGEVRKVTSATSNIKDKSVTFTLSKIPRAIEGKPETEDADFEIID
jgi:hypothetical protein